MKSNSFLKEIFWVSAISGIIGGIMNLILYQLTTSGPVQVIPFPIALIAAFYYFAKQKNSTPLYFIKSFCIGFFTSLVFCLLSISNAFYQNHYNREKNLPITIGDFRMILFPIIASVIIGLLIALFIWGMQMMVIRQRKIN